MGTDIWTAASSSSSTRERVGLTCDNARATLLVQSHARTRAWLSALGPQS